MLRWRGRVTYPKPEQVANACDDFVDLSPVSDAPADAVKAAWLPLQAGQTVPLIGERDGYIPEEDDC